MESAVQHRWLTWVAFVLHSVIGVMPYLASGLLAPIYALPFVLAMWVAFAVLLWRLRDRPTRAILVPPAALVAWGVVMFLGDALLGWTA